MHELARAHYPLPQKQIQYVFAGRIRCVQLAAWLNFVNSSAAPGFERQLAIFEQPAVRIERQSTHVASVNSKAAFKVARALKVVPSAIVSELERELSVAPVNKRQ